MSTARWWESLHDIVLFSLLVCILAFTPRDFSPRLLHLCSGLSHKTGIEGPVKKLLLNKPDSEAKVWWHANQYFTTSATGWWSTEEGWQGAPNTVSDLDRKGSQGNPVSGCILVTVALHAVNIVGQITSQLAWSHFWFSTQSTFTTAFAAV